MKLSELERKLADFIASDEDRAIGEEVAIRPELVGTPYFGKPILGCARADDPLFAQFKGNPNVIGRFLRLPDAWLPGARSVVSVFFPFSKQVRDSNRSADRWPSAAWLHARIEGQAFLEKAMRHVREWLESEGARVVIPALSQDFRLERDNREGPSPFVGNWSERHAAYIAGQGTFGLSKHLITPEGVCGRFGSVVTDAVFEVTPRAYAAPFEYCTSCGLCASRCPVGAISLERGKDDRVCNRFLDEVRDHCAPRYGCGKCQLNVPCECGIPRGRRLAEVTGVAP